MLFTNVVVGKPLVEPFHLLANGIQDWETNEKSNTLFTNTQWLPSIMVEAGLVKSNSEVRKNKPELCIELNKIDFLKVKWGKKFLWIVVGE